ncbi:MAG: sulfatase-like hydrolase/transferase, partial [Myxococcota bacterium]|nr:sulfatase-like hydrolase/transferase [Myxococcota bacterium]
STASVCAPSLQTLLTGLHPHQWIVRKEQIEQNIGAFIPRGLEVSYFDDTLPKRLSRLGYRSFQAGKHWEGTFAMAGFDAGTAQAFTAGVLNTDGSNFGRPDPIDPLWDFVDTAGSEPLLFWLAPKLPHVPLDPPAEFQMLYGGQGLAPDAVLYYANITRLDALIGEILAGFSSRGLLENTLVIYLSDNGWEQDPFIEHWVGGIIGGRRGKLSIHELGFRTPVIFNWPGRVPSGQVFNDLVSFEDVFTTILDYAGSPPGADARGVSLKGRIEDPSEPVARNEIIGVMDSVRKREAEWVPGSGLGGLWSHERAAFVRTRDWRYLSYVDRGEIELYRIEEDPFEDFDLAAPGNTYVSAALDVRLQTWLDSYLTVPEPSSSLLSACAVAVLALLRRGRQRIGL